MANRFAFTVHAVPKQQPRQRHRIVTGVGGNWVQNYTPKAAPVNAYKAAVSRAAADCVRQPLGGPLLLSLVFVMPRPKAMVWKTKLMSRKPDTRKRPDMDNLLKSTMDALTGILYRDDGQVFSVTAMKLIAAGGETPHVQV